MDKALRKLASSKKATVLVASWLVAGGMAFDGSIPVGEFMEFVKWSLLGYLGAQGASDSFGKGKFEAAVEEEDAE